MSTITVYQFDHAGMYAGETDAYESPLEPGVWLMPAGAVDVAPPAEWPAGQHPRWTGSAWELISKPASPAEDPVAKLAAFLEANPDVRELIEPRPEI